MTATGDAVGEPDMPNLHAPLIPADIVNQCGPLRHPFNATLEPEETPPTSQPSLSVYSAPLPRQPLEAVVRGGLPWLLDSVL